MFKFEHPLLIYIPSYNVKQRLIPLIDEIPAELWKKADIMVVDNHSSDGSFQSVTQANRDGRWPKPVFLAQPDKNLGYSGSQKFAYNMVLQSPTTRTVVMLHGDGQYPPELVSQLLKYQDEAYDVVYGYRSWRHFWRKDETPWSSYLTIKVLSLIESLLTGYFRREWHSGFVMYKKTFLERIDFNNITKTMHIDGHLLFAAGKLKRAVKAVPIFKRYKNYPALSPTARISYVIKVLSLMPKLHFIPIAKKPSTNRSSSSSQANQKKSVKPLPTSEVQL